MAKATPETIEKPIKVLTKGEGATADDLAKEFREHSVAEFFKKNKQMLGLSGKTKALIRKVVSQ